MKRRQTAVAMTILLMVNLLIPNAAVAAAPATPVQESPANGETDLPTWVAVRWTLSNPGEVYRVQVATNPAMTALVVDATVSNATAYSLYAVARKNTTYYWRVNATKDRSTSAWSPIRSFTTTNKSTPPAPSLVSPENGASGFPVSQGVTLVWNAVAGAESYDFQIADEASFSAPFIQWYAYGGTSKHVIGLEEAYTSRLYWRVRGRNPGGAGSWSEVRVFTVDPFR
ncbi:MAG TPA: fibronectin type III domain-containing protein [Anaerolineae bacterium]|nr:fibronectin type III domain-containing protein [Anaerolineae bacterium]